MSKKNFNFSKLQEGQIFKSFTELCLFITGEKPPTGKKNQDALKRQFSRYIKFEKLRDIYPHEKSKHAIIILEIYHQPKELSETRGKSGKYSDWLKPLLISNRSFSGKTYVLYNQLGIFSAYLHTLTHTSLDGLQGSFYTYNPWKTESVLGIGAVEYKRICWNTMRGALKRSLDALQQEGLIHWQEYYKLIPAVKTKGGENTRFKAQQEIREMLEYRDHFLDELSSDKNVVLLPALVRKLNIFDSNWSHPTTFLDYKKNSLTVDNKFYPLRASLDQGEAIQNLEQFMRQYAYKEYYGMEGYPKFEDVPNEYEFFKNPYLRNKYQKLVITTYPFLIGCEYIWKELEYNTSPSCSQNENFDKYNFSFDKELYARMLTLSFIDYMDKHMHLEFMPSQKHLDDLQGRTFGRMSLLLPVPLSMSKSATALHEQLHKLYE